MSYQSARVFSISGCLINWLVCFQYQDISSIGLRHDSLIVSHNYTTFSNLTPYNPIMNILDEVSPSHASLTHLIRHLSQVLPTPSYWIGHPSQILLMPYSSNLNISLKCHSHHHYILN